MISKLKVQCLVILLSLDLTAARGATGLGGISLGRAEGIKCGPQVEIELSKAAKFRTGPGWNYRVVPDDDNIRYDTTVLKRRGDWLDLDGSTDLWVNVRQVYVSLDRSNVPKFNLLDGCLKGVSIRIFDSHLPIRHHWKLTDHGYVWVENRPDELRHEDEGRQ